MPGTRRRARSRTDVAKARLLPVETRLRRRRVRRARGAARVERKVGCLSSQTVRYKQNAAVRRRFDVRPKWEVDVGVEDFKIPGVEPDCAKPKAQHSSEAEWLVRCKAASGVLSRGSGPTLQAAQPLCHPPPQTSAFHKALSSPIIVPAHRRLRQNALSQLKGMGAGS